MSQKREDGPAENSSQEILGGLVDRFAKRESGAEELLLLWCKEFSFPLLMRLLRNPGAVEEAQQELLFALHRRRFWDRLISIRQKGGNLVGFIAVTVRNFGLDYLRRNKKWSQKMVLQPGQMPAQQPDPSNEVSEETHAALAICLATLDEETRAFLERRFGFHGCRMTLAEVGEEWGISEEAAKKRIQRILAKLLICMQKQRREPE